MSATTSVSNATAQLQTAVIMAVEVVRALQVSDIATETLQQLQQQLNESHKIYSKVPLQPSSTVTQSLRAQYLEHYQAAENRLSEQTQPIQTVDELQNRLNTLLYHLTTYGHETKVPLGDMRKEFDRCTQTMDQFKRNRQASSDYESVDRGLQSCQLLLRLLEMNPSSSTSLNSPSQNGSQPPDDSRYTGCVLQ